VITVGVDLAAMDRNRCDWATAFATGVRFCYLRDAFSTADDPTYELEAPRARAAGVKPGPYFFPDERITAVPMAQQIAAFVANVKKHEQPGDLPAAFDVEYSNGYRATGRSRVELLRLIVEIATGLTTASATGRSSTPASA
jgi:lysozyme